MKIRQIIAWMISEEVMALNFFTVALYLLHTGNNLYVNDRILNRKTKN